MDTFGKKLLKWSAYIVAIISIWGALTGIGGYVIEKIYHKEITEFVTTVEYTDSLRTKVIPTLQLEIKELQEWKKKKSIYPN